MRGSLGKLSNPVIGIATKRTLIPSSSTFSTSSGGGGGGGSGRGRGQGSSVIGPSDSQIAASTPPLPGKTEASGDGDDPKGDFRSSPFPSGLGHGRGKPLPSMPTLPSYSSFMSAVSSTSIDGDGAGRGRATAPPPHPQAEPEQFGPKRPIFFTKEEPSSDSVTTKPIIPRNPLSQDNDLPSGILSMLSGAGRGKPAKQSVPNAKAKEENGHLRPLKPGKGIGVGSTSGDGSLPQPKLSCEEAVKKAVGILSKGGFVADTMEDGGRGRGGFRGRGNRGRGSQGWRGRGRGRGRDGRVQDGEDDFGADLYLGDDADGEKLAKTLGPDKMNQLVEAFEEMSGRVLPSPMEDAYLDALHTNYMIECEPEYLMEDFGTNPDIDEKLPVSLRDALEKMKPFLMAYEGIQSQSEWEEVVKEAMERVPIIKELVDYYSGPDRVTAKKQHEELERVAKTLPESAPASVKWFTERAVLSLQVGVVSTYILLFSGFLYSLTLSIPGVVWSYSMALLDFPQGTSAPTTVEVYAKVYVCVSALLTGNLKPVWKCDEGEATQGGDLIKNASLWIDWWARYRSSTSKHGMVGFVGCSLMEGFTVLIKEDNHEGFQVLVADGR
ncbi:hypothetical protein RHSIM_Rhsim06G0244600 [Rhododendron simsii]|uniref:Uncharacterized protein n=1 Tax=Rhododendron simsii TaxID=118357 RepID=A0A834GUV3_RHOSS|nr:hypothetical protein RHSIM_Rhsim06G0244600 [Rhododendron simsii]